MTTPYYPILGQIDLTGIINNINAQFGAVAALFALICILLFNIYRNQENAKTERRKAETEQVKAKTERDKEDVRQEAIINDIVERAGKLETELRETVKAQYVAEGRATAYEKQIQYLQEKFEIREKESARDYRKLKNAYLRIDKRLKDLGVDLQKEKEENTRLNEALNTALRNANNLKTQLETSETLRRSDRAAWDKEKYQFEETIHQLHEDIRAMKEITVALDDAVLDQLDVPEVAKEFQSADTPSPAPTLGEPPTEA